MDTVGGFIATLGSTSLLLFLAGLGIWLWALVDCLGRSFPHPTQHLVWLLVVLFGFLPGALLYLIAGRSQGNR